MKPAVTLPLSPSMNRCLAEGQKVGESCERKDQCARHVTIEHDDEPVPAYYRACHSDLMVAFIPLTGWPEEEVDQVIVNSAKVEIDYLKITGQGGSGFIPEELTSAPRLRGETVEPTGHGMKTITHLPGGTTITRHKAS